MTLCVLDSSIALCWVLPNEEPGPSDRLLADIIGQGAVAPALWLMEVANVLLMSERRGRITVAERIQALSLLKNLPVQIEPATAMRLWDRTVELAAAHRLTVYDATYLETALRLALPLATRDRALEGAARDCGVVVLGA